MSFAGLVHQDLDSIIHRPPHPIFFDAPLPPYVASNPWVNQVFVTITVGRYFASQYVYSMCNVLVDARVLVQQQHKHCTTPYQQQQQGLKEYTYDMTLVPSTFNDMKMFAVLMTKFANPDIPERVCVDQVAQVYSVIIGLWEKAFPAHQSHKILDPLKTFAYPGVRRRMKGMLSCVSDTWLCGKTRVTFGNLTDLGGDIRHGMRQCARHNIRAYKEMFPSLGSLLEELRPEKIAELVSRAFSP